MAKRTLTYHSLPGLAACGTAERPTGPCLASAHADQKAGQAVKRRAVFELLNTDTFSSIAAGSDYAYLLPEPLPAAVKN